MQWDLRELFPGVPPYQLSLLSSSDLGILLMSFSLAFCSPQHMLGQVVLMMSPRAQGCHPGTLPGLSGQHLHATTPTLLERERQGFGGDGPSPSHSKKQKSCPQRRLSAVLPVLVQPEQQAVGLHLLSLCRHTACFLSATCCPEGPTLLPDPNRSCGVQGNSREGGSPRCLWRPQVEGQPYVPALRHLERHSSPGLSSKRC